MAGALEDVFRVGGTVLERKYRVDEPVAEGGFGIVYAGHHLGLDVPIAIKLLKPDDAADDWSERLAPFFDEARLIAKLRHPSIVAVLDTGTTHIAALGIDVPWLVLEWIDGETLRQDLGRRRARGARGRSPAECMQLLRPVLEAIAVAHEAGIVHRDLKPNNVMLANDGKGGTVARVLDFGVAKVMRREEGQGAPSGDTATQSRASAFTAESAAPEQLSGTRTGPWTDVFALALMLVELLTDRSPWEAGDANEHYRAVFAPERPTPSRLGVDVGAWEPVLARALAVRPADRQKDARTLVAELDEGLRAMGEAASRASPAVVASDSALPESGFAATEPNTADRAKASPTTLRARRGNATVAAVAIAGLGALSAGAFFLRTRGVAPSAPDSAAPAPPVVFAMSSPPAQITTAGLCSGSPVYADDGSIVFVRQQQKGGSVLVRLDPTTREERVLTPEPGSHSRPGPGAAGQVVYAYRKGGGSPQIRAVGLDGNGTQTLEAGDDPWVAGKSLFFLRGDDRGIRRRALDGSVDEIVFEAPSTSIFESLVVSPDARWIAAVQGGLDSGRPMNPVCMGEIGSGRGLDCTTAGITTGRRAAFSPDGRAAYVTKPEGVTRVELATRGVSSYPLAPPPTTLAIARDGSSLVFSTCHTVYEAVRVDLAGAKTPLPVVSGAVGTAVAGPHGELAFPVAAGSSTALAIADDPTGARRVLTSGDRLITEPAFSPDGTRIAFHDGAPETGGIFVIDAKGTLAPTRITTTPTDSTPAWIDADHVVFMRAEEGLPYGRVLVVSAAGGEATPLPKLPGTLVGAVPSKGTLLLAYQSPGADRLVEATRTGEAHDVPLPVLAKEAPWQLFTAASPSGRWIGWISNGRGWRADLRTGKSSPIEVDASKGSPITAQADDDGAVVISYRHSEGQLYEVRGTFR
jgi:serine/threonine protein kinase